MEVPSFFKNYLWETILSFLVLIIVAWFTVGFAALGASKQELADYGTFGDWFGALNAVFSSGALIAAIAAIFLQRKELKETTKAQKAVVKAQVLIEKISQLEKHQNYLKEQYEKSLKEYGEAKEKRNDDARNFINREHLDELIHELHRGLTKLKLEDIENADQIRHYKGNIDEIMIDFDITLWQKLSS